MQKVDQDYCFSTVVTNSMDENEFTVEFTQVLPGETPAGSPIKITHNFDELMDFLEEIEE